MKNTVRHLSQRAAAWHWCPFSFGLQIYRYAAVGQPEINWLVPVYFRLPPIRHIWVPQWKICIKDQFHFPQTTRSDLCGLSDQEHLKNWQADLIWMPCERGHNLFQVIPCNSGFFFFRSLKSPIAPCWGFVVQAPSYVGVWKVSYRCKEKELLKPLSPLAGIYADW